MSGAQEGDSPFLPLLERTMAMADARRQSSLALRPAYLRLVGSLA